VLRTEGHAGRVKLAKWVQLTHPSVKLDASQLAMELSPEEAQLFTAMKIGHPTDIQHTVFRFGTALEGPGRFFLSFRTGQGKTACCLAIACARASS